MIKAKFYIKTLLLAVMTAVLIAPYAHCHNLFQRIEIENHKHNHLTLVLFYSCERVEHYSGHNNRNELSEDSPHHGEEHVSHGTYHHSHTGQDESGRNTFQNSAEWHCNNDAIHFHFLSDFLPADETREYSPVPATLSKAARTNDAPCTNITLAYLKAKALHISATNFQDFISISTDLPPPAV